MPSNVYVFMRDFFFIEQVGWRVLRGGRLGSEMIWGCGCEGMWV